MWSLLRGRRLAGYKFRRQQLIGGYIVDFVCMGRRLVVEVNGGGHLRHAAEDREREAGLRSYGYRVLRLSDRELLTAPDSAQEAVLAALEAGAPVSGHASYA